ncbi:hypothetical protein ACG02S_02680 [Roseateles sp. DC23W]|uniref:PEP-CTERM protein-sorting domain-containing protein n=1 Tax=Pelomonas dachongensis TaxID=3299029 RepID=A0ABW7EH75_9BURK
MKALILAATLVALSFQATAGAAQDAQVAAVADARATTVMADAGRLGSASLSALNASRWDTVRPQAAAEGSPLDAFVPNVDAGTLLVSIAVLAFALSRPVSRVLRRQAQQRRATALAATLPHETQR